MKAVLFKGIRQLEVIDRPIPQPGPGQVLLKVSLTGICMTDVHIYLGHFAVKPPRILGHEVTGEVVSTGSGVDTAWIGRSAGVFPAQFCGTCGPCLRGQQELCENFKCLGNTSDGGFAEYTLVDASQLVDLNAVTMEQAVWLEPLACIMLGLKKITIPKNSSGLVIGAGTLGKLMAQVLKINNGARVAVVDPNPEKIAEAKSLGALAGWSIPRTGPTGEVDTQINQWAPQGLQFIIDTSGSSVAIQRAFHWAGTGTGILLFGVTDPQAVVQFSPAEFFSKELHLAAVAGMTQDSFKAAYRLLTTGRLNTSALVGQKISLDELPAHMERLAQHSAAKTLVQP